ncbi:hypothetical protein [Bradyrhizobium sp. cf659]|uniref:hypothetical protein n=1 Tax=Bradyrhizobium sp. cf659 TaxID=1761771 RepID=UPI0008E6FBA4|nr:hypothetical protein [Bradyrhizobium sp. cf659]SFI31048.1 hypothetical protein SAMN04487925_102659 [Bradyrhizobium sp. cf659]
MAITQLDIDKIQELLDSGDRAGAYIYYYELIKDVDPSAGRQILIQAQITTYSGFFGGAALIGNALAKHANPDLYPPTLDGFSVDIVQGLINAIKADFTNGDGIPAATRFSGPIAASGELR